MKAMPTIKCPRCEGHGVIRKFLRIAQGRCFRCNGRGTVEIDPKRHFRALHHLRGRYVALSAHVHSLEAGEPGIPGLGESLEEARKALRDVVTDGRRVRHEIELIGLDPDD